MTPTNADQTILTAAQARAEHSERATIAAARAWLAGLLDWLPRPQDAPPVAENPKRPQFPTSLFGEGWDK